MAPTAVGRPAKYCSSPRRGLPAALVALVVATSANLWGGAPRQPAVSPQAVDAWVGDWSPDMAPAAAADGTPLFSRQSPPILRPDYTGTVQVEVTYAGSFTHLRVFESRNGGTSHVFQEFPVVATPTLEGRTVSVFRPSWTMGVFVRTFGVAIDVDSGIGATLLIAPSSVPLGPNGAPTIGDNVFIRAMSTTVGDVPVVQVDPSVQYSSHVVNIVVPGMAQTEGEFPGGVTAATSHFYSYFGDDYDQLAIVYREEPFSRFLSGGGHSINRSRIGGIGLTVNEGSVPGRLEGTSFYLHTLNNGIVTHELLHQWGHYFYWPGIAGIDPLLSATHDPLWGHLESPLAAFLAPNIRLRPLGGLEWETERAPEPTRLPPLLAYAMGRLAPAAVPPMDVFQDQNRVWTVWTGVRMSGATRRVTIDDVIAYHGPRTGPAVTDVRQATLLLSRDALATPAEMAYWTLQAQRLEDPDQTGMISEAGLGSFRAVTGVPLITRIIPPVGRPTLTGHTMLEPNVLDPHDLAGVVVDAPPRFEVPSEGVFRLQGRIVEPALAGASRIAIQHGGNPLILSSPVASDGSFSIMGSPSQGAGRYGQRLFVTIDGLDRNIAFVRNMRYFGETRVPPPPVAVNARANGNNVSITWAPDTGSSPSTYRLDVGSVAGASNIGTIPLNTTSLSAAGVPNGRYYLRVRAANTAGVSAPSAEAVLDVGACAPPQPATAFAATATGSTLSLGWQPSPSAGASYTIVAGSTAGASDIAQAPVGTVTSLTVPGVPAGRYFLRVRATTACGTADSNEVQVVVGAAQAPGVPMNLTGQVTGTTVLLSWQAASGAVTGYILEAGSASGSSNLVVAPVGQVLSFSAPGVPRGTYFVRVRAFNAVGQSAPSNEAVLVVP